MTPSVVSWLVAPWRCTVSSKSVTPQTTAGAAYPCSYSRAPETRQSEPSAWTEIDDTLGLVWHDLKTRLESFGLKYFSTDGWGAYTCHLDAAQHTASKRYTQKMERKHLTLRTRITRLVRTTILVSTRFLV